MNRFLRKTRSNLPRSTRKRQFAGRQNLKIALALLIGVLLFLVLTILMLRWVNPPYTSFTLQENWEEIGDGRYSLRDYWVEWDRLPDHLKWAVIAYEDQRFWEHHGLDLEAIGSALEEQTERGEVRGASTITQQVAKNLFLWPGRSWFRKGVEAGLALLIELLWPKERILEVYLNSAEFGPGLFGVGRATEAYFGTSPEKLEPDASARLAAVLPSPKRMRVEPPSPYTRERSRWILRQMQQLSGVSYLPKSNQHPASGERDREMQRLEPESALPEENREQIEPVRPLQIPSVQDEPSGDEASKHELSDDEPDSPDQQGSSSQLNR